MLKKSFALCFASLCLPMAAQAAQLNVEIEIPRLDVAEYHRPYVAIWIEQGNQHIADLAVWYDLKMKNNEGEKWLKDMRQWWRRSGRTLNFPIDGVSSATRAVGKHQLSFDSQNPVLSKLPAGDYQLLVEAAREVGGRELIKIPFTWPPQAEHTETAQGSTELGAIVLQVKP